MADELCVNTIRVLAADTVQKANSGHPGMPMGMAPIAHVLWNKFMNVDPSAPKWFNRDRFVLSNGHGCALLYIMLHLSGFDVSMDDLKSFRQLDSKCPGHPENVLTPGIEVTTGPLGQGISNAVGMAMARDHLAARFNKEGFPVVDNFVYVFCGDGCLMEGVSSEACSLAGHLGLGRLIAIYDDNKISIDGSTDIAFTEDVARRYEAYGWKVITVANGDSDFAGMSAALDEARATLDKPVLIKLRTTIGYGAKVQGISKAHGAPLGNDDVANVKRKFGFDPAVSFHVSDEVYSSYAAMRARGTAHHAAWNALMTGYRAAFPELSAEFDRATSGALPPAWRDALPKFTPADAVAGTRKYSEMVLNKMAEVIPEMFGGSADLAESNLTHLKSSGLFQRGSYGGRNIAFGVREHGMAAICNGIAAYGGLIPYCATFLNFIGYAQGAVRLSALSDFGVLYIATHDSIGLGEDGPTHQPIEMLPLLRCTPNFLVLRPADGNEVAGSYAVALHNRHRPSLLALSRQNAPHLVGSDAAKVASGAYVLSESSAASSAAGAGPELILVGTGSELQFCVQAAVTLAESHRVRVVSMPSWELFEEQTAEYKASVFPAGVPVLSVEASSVMGWDKYSHAQIGMHTFGKSGPLKDVMKHFGFTVENVVARSRQLLAYYSTRPVPALGSPFDA